MDNEEVVVDTTNNGGEGEETVTITKKDYDKLNQDFGSIKREHKDLKKELDGFKNPKGTPDKTKDLSTDYGLLALLKVNNIEHDDDKALFFKVQSETGKKPEEVLGSKYFLADLKEQQEIRATKEAQPKDNNRGNSSGRTEASIWVEKVNTGKATMADVPAEVRLEVINLRALASTPQSSASSILDKIKINQSK